jgi:MYXO-CTERM domain-containing protein
MRRHLSPRTVAGLAFAASTFTIGIASAATINVGPGDDYTKIEAAMPGDLVVIAPGTYTFRVHLTKTAPSNNPIVIRAQDPLNPPVWDLSSTLVESAPGSYTAGDRGRGCWQLSGGTNYVIESIVFTGCHTSTFDSAGIRYYNGASVTIRDCLFKDNDDGLTGGTQDSTAVVEFCEFDHNGNSSASSSAPTHNLYIYGGTFEMRYSYVHDSAQAENFHIRSKRATLEANWFSRAKNYEGDLMTDDDFATQTGPFTQNMLVTGNVFVQAASPGNSGQVLVIYNDQGTAGDTMMMQVVNNTFIGNGGNSAFVHLSNADGTTMSADVSNNVIFGTTRPTLVESAGSGTITGKNNWLATGVNPGALTASVFSAMPGFMNAAGKDFTLAVGSAAIGKAAALSMGLPLHEYFQNETVKRQYRVRATAKDIGAFESTTTGPGIGPYGAMPTPDGGAGAEAGSDDGGVILDDAGNPIVPDGGAGGDGGANGASGGDDSGCGCVVVDGDASTSGAAFGAIAAAAIAFARRRGRRHAKPLTPSS